MRPRNERWKLRPGNTLKKIVLRLHLATMGWVRRWKTPMIWPVFQNSRTALGQESEHGTATLRSCNFFAARSEICTGESSSRLRSHSRNMRRVGWPTGFPSRIASSRFASILTLVVINIASDRATRESPGSTTLSERPGRAAIRSSNRPLAASAAGKLSLGEAAWVWSQSMFGCSR